MELFAPLQSVQTQIEFERKVQQESTRRDWLKDILNKWPGDESIEDIMKESESK